MPTAAGTPRYEKPELWLGTTNWHGGFCDAPPRPQRGTSPRATFSPPRLVESGGDLPRPRPGRFANRPYRNRRVVQLGPAGLLVAARQVDDLLAFYREVDGVDDLQEL